MIRRLLALFGLKIVYACEWGTYDSMIPSWDLTSGCPVHKDMSCAPPWAKMKIVSKETPSK